MGINLGALIPVVGAGGQIAGALPSSSPGSNQGTFATVGTISSLAATGGAAGVAAAGGTASVAATAAGGGLSGAAATTLAVLPVVGAVIAALAIIALKIFKGADPRQVPASKIVEAFNVAKRLIGYAYMHGMITQDEALAGIEYLRQVGHQLYQQNAAALGPTITANSVANLDGGLNDSLTAIQTHSPTSKETLDVSQVANWSIKINPYTGANDGRDIYPESVAAGYGIAQKYLETIGQGVVGGALSVVNGVTDKIAASIGISGSMVKVLAAGLAGLLLLKRFI